MWKLLKGLGGYFKPRAIQAGQSVPIGFWQGARTTFGGHFGNISGGALKLGLVGGAGYGAYRYTLSEAKDLALDRAEHQFPLPKEGDFLIVPIYKDGEQFKPDYTGVHSDHWEMDGDKVVSVKLQATTPVKGVTDFSAAIIKESGSEHQKIITSNYTKDALLKSIQDRSVENQQYHDRIMASNGGEAVLQGYLNVRKAGEQKTDDRSIIDIVKENPIYAAAPLALIVAAIGGFGIPALLIGGGIAAAGFFGKDILNGLNKKKEEATASTAPTTPATPPGTNVSATEPAADKNVSPTALVQAEREKMGGTTFESTDVAETPTVAMAGAQSKPLEVPGVTRTST